MDAPVTANAHAALSLVASADTTEMLLANDSGFTGSAWQAFVPTANWTLAPDPESGIATVFVRYRDAAGNESPTTYHDAIEVVSSLSVGTIDGQAWLAPSITVAGITLETVGEADTPLAFTPQSGNFSLDNLPAGTYDLRVSYPGYDTAVVPDIVVPGGGLVRIGTIVLDPTDTDGDGTPDAEDNCILQANGPLIPDAGGNVQRDTDGDGYGNVCDPDFDNSLVVNAADLAFMKTMFFKVNPDADLNGDGIVNASDLAKLKVFFFKPPGPSGLVP
jgi:hypothetical protein